MLFDRDGDGTADRVAIVAEVTEGGFAAIEGNAEHAVGQRAYETADAAILGYVVLPQGPKEFTLTAQSESGITVTVTGPRESLPCAAREITLAVTEQVDEESRAVRDQLLAPVIPNSIVVTVTSPCPKYSGAQRRSRTRAFMACASWPARRPSSNGAVRDSTISGT